MTTTRPRPGELWTAVEGTKVRPVLIINDGLGLEIDVSILRVTSQKTRNEYDIALNDWEEAGLKKASVVRVSKLSTIHYLLCRDYIGKVSKADMENIKSAFIKFYLEGFKDFNEESE
jgi:mRNA interferase MazF